MTTTYAQKPFPRTVTRTLFLAGPTPREEGIKKGVRSWRPEALAYLQDYSPGTHVFVPEADDGVWRGNYDPQVEWETAALARADSIVFWVPREIETMPGFTTNVEFGLHVCSERTFYGRPKNAPKTAFLDFHAGLRQLPVYDTLKDVLKAAVSAAGAAVRHGPDVMVPTLAWLNPGFADWYNAAKDAGDTLLRCEIPYASPTGFLFRYRMWVASRDAVVVDELYFHR